MPIEKLTVALSPSARVRGILDGRITVGGVKFELNALSTAEVIWRQLRFNEFDVSELSLASYMVALSNGSENWVGLPVFPTRFFPHVGIIVRGDAGIKKPADLRGKTVGVSEYQQTSLVWIRGILQHHFGVEPGAMQWIVERSPSASHGAATGFTTPAGVSIRFAPFDSSLGDLMHEKKLDAILYHPHDPFDRRGPTLLDEAHLLFTDQIAEIRRYYEATHLFPLNQCIVVRRSIARECPELLGQLYRAFLQAKRLSEVELLESLGLIEHAYGVDGALDELTTLHDYLYEQQLLARKVALEEMFTDVRLA